MIKNNNIINEYINIIICLLLKGIYEMQIKLSGVPLLVSEPPPLTSDITAEDFMSDTVCAIPHIIMVGKLVDILNTTKHNGFPVVAPKVCFCQVNIYR